MGGRHDPELAKRLHIRASQPLPLRQDCMTHRTRPQRRARQTVSLLGAMPLLVGAVGVIHLGDLKVLSAPGDAFHAEIPVLGATSRPRLRAAVTQGQGRDLTVTEVTTRDHTLVLLASPEPLSPDGLTLRIQVESGNQVYGATYHLTPNAQGQLHHIYAGQMTGGTDEGWYGASGGPRPYDHVIVHRGDTLDNIARRLSKRIPESAERIAAALFEANASAFERGDPRHLRTGAALNVPSVVDIHLIPLHQADQFVRYLDGHGENPYRPQHTPTVSRGSDPISRVLNGISLDTVLATLRSLAPYLGGAFVLLAGIGLARRLHRRYTLWRKRRRGLRQIQERQHPGEDLATRVRRERIAQLEHRLTLDPDDLDLQIRLAREYLSSGESERYRHLTASIRKRGTTAHLRRLDRLEQAAARERSRVSP